MQIVSPDSTSVQEFGYSVAIADTFIVIGAPGDDMMHTQNGMAYIFKLGNNDGQLTADLDKSLMPMGLNAYARYGHAVAIYYGSENADVPESALSDWVVIGAPGLNSTGMVFVYVKIYATTEWITVGEVWPRDVDSAVKFGRAVAWYNDFMVQI